LTGEGEDIKLNKLPPFFDTLCITRERGFYSLSGCTGEKKRRSFFLFCCSFQLIHNCG